MNRESMISIDWAKSRRNHRLSAEAAMRELKALYGNDESLFDQKSMYIGSTSIVSQAGTTSRVIN